MYYKHKKTGDAEIGEKCNGTKEIAIFEKTEENGAKSNKAESISDGEGKKTIAVGGNLVRRALKVKQLCNKMFTANAWHSNKDQRWQERHWTRPLWMMIQTATSD